MTVLLTTGQRILDLARRSGNSLPTACEAIGVRYGTIHAQIKNKRQIPFDTIDKLARFYNVPLAYFSPNTALLSVHPNGETQGDDIGVIEAQRQISSTVEKVLKAGYLPDADTVLDWLEREGGVLQNYGFLRDRFELFYPLKKKTDEVKLAEVGHKSLASIFFNAKGREDFQSKISSFPDPTREMIFEDHWRVRETSSYTVGDVSISVPVDGNVLSAKYRKIMAPVRTPGGARLTLVYARLIHARETPLDVQSGLMGTP